MAAGGDLAAEIKRARRAAIPTRRDLLLAALRLERRVRKETSPTRRCWHAIATLGSRATPPLSVLELQPHKILEASVVTRRPFRF